MRRIINLLFLLTIVFLYTSTANAAVDITDIPYYKDIPGVTEADVAAVEALKARYEGFTYGHLVTSEAFMMPDGTYAGFTIRFCELLSELFGTPFNHVPYDWNGLLSAVAEKKADFTASFIPSVQKQQEYFKTNVIVRHSLNVYYPNSTKEIKNENDLNGLNVGFLQLSYIPDLIHNTYPQLTYNIVVVNDYDDAIAKMRRGEIDALVTATVSDPFFVNYSFIRSKGLFPLVKLPCAMLTANAELKPIIDVVGKYLAAGGIDTLYSLYEEGDTEYTRYELNRSFTKEELQYLTDLKENNKSIMVAMASTNYPLCFYNDSEQEYQGIAPDILTMISNITGIKFQYSTEKGTLLTEILDQLESGQTPMAAHIFYTDMRKDYFLWADTPYATAHYALVTKLNYPFLTIRRLERIKVGTIVGSAYEQKFVEWFPLNDNVSSYTSYIKAIEALDSGQIDAFMSSEYALLMQANYYGKPDYKVNMLFDTPLESYFTFNKKEKILCSIISKAQQYIDINSVEYMWMNRIFDYAKRYAYERASALVVFAVFMFLALVSLAVLFIKNKRLNLNLENTVKSRTHELELQTVELIRMSSIADNSPLYMSYVNMDGKFDYVNPATCEITGYSVEELKQHGLKILYDEETNRRIRDEIFPKIFELGKYEFELPLTRKDGEKRLMVFSTFTIASDEYGCGFVAMDITEKKLLEEQLIEAKELAVQNSRSKSDFLSHMSHEIRTPMNAVIGMTKIAKSSDSLERKNDCLDKIDSASTHLLGVINDVLDMSKIEAGKFELSYSEFNIEKIISRISIVFQYRMEEKKQTFKVHLNDDLPHSIISDEQRLNQVLTNLIGNAVKFTPECGLISLHVRKISEDNGICGLEFEVRDTGIGIPKELHDRVFMSYDQGSGNISGKYGGTGLGLPISKHIVEMFGGKIWVKSEQGNGSGFFFTLYARTGAVSQDFTKGKDTSKSGEEDDIRLQGKHILLAEDVEINREIVIAMLEPTGLIIDCAENGIEAVNMFIENPNYALIFMDVQMPELDGLEATKKIRALSHPLAQSIPIIAMTANVFRDDIDNCLSSGMNDHIGKPLELNDIKEKLKQYLT